MEMESNSSSSTSDSDPSTPRNRTNNGINKKDKKIKKRSRRTSNRLRKMMLLSKIRSQAADRSYLDTVCVTRTVEWPATQKIGVEKSKLLFMLAIGLNPEPGAIRNLPRVEMTRMSTSEESKARTKTRARLFEMYRKQKREADELRLRAEQFLNNAPSRPSPENNVEIVNLVSDDEDEGDQNDETEAAQPYTRVTRQRVLVNGSSFTSVNTDHEATSSNQKVITNGGPRSLQPLLSKKTEKIFFQKWKPESFSKLIDGKNAKEYTLPSLNGANKKLMAPLKNAIPASSPLTVRNQASTPIRSTNSRLTGGLYKTQTNNGAVGASTTSTPENLIIIDID